MTLVAGIDSSTQSGKIVIADAADGTVLRSANAPHPPGTEIDPSAWRTALQRAVERAGGLHDVAAISVAGQQHGLVALDSAGAVVRPALLWNDTRSAQAGDDLVAELGGGSRERGAEAFAARTGSVPLAAFTITKLRWLAEHEPERARRVAAACLPHDWLTWRLGRSTGSSAAGAGGELAELRTDRSDASGTGYFATPSGERYCADLVRLAFGRDLALPEVLAPAGRAEHRSDRGHRGFRLGGRLVPAAHLHAERSPGPGRGRPAAVGEPGAALRTRVVRAVGSGWPNPGAVSGRGAHPNRRGATGALRGITAATLTPRTPGPRRGRGCCVRAGRLRGRAGRPGRPPARYLLVDGVARSPAVRQITAEVLGRPVLAPRPGEHVTIGAARQAAWALSGAAAPPRWPRPQVSVTAGRHVWATRERYARLRELFADRG